MCVGSSQCFGGAFQLAGLRVIAPYHGGSVELFEAVPQTCLGALSADRRSVEDEGDHLTPLRVRAPGQFVTLDLNLLSNTRDRGVDKFEQRPRGYVEQFV